MRLLILFLWILGPNVRIGLARMLSQDWVSASACSQIIAALGLRKELKWDSFDSSTPEDAAVMEDSPTTSEESVMGNMSPCIPESNESALSAPFLNGDPLAMARSKNRAGQDLLT